MEFPSNSHKVTDKSKAKEKPEKVVTKVVTGEVIQQKKSLGARIKNLFVSGEIRGVMLYITSDVLLPAVRNMVVDATTEGIKRAVYGDTAPRRRHEMGRSRISYNSAPTQRASDRYGRSTMLPDQPPHQVRRRNEPNDLILASRVDAEAVVERMQDIVDQYEVASVADLHELVGLPTSFIDNKWGWSSLHQVDVRQVRDGWFIDLPPVEPI